MSSFNNTSRIEVIAGVHRRKRVTLVQKLELGKHAFEPGMTFSMVARQTGISAAQLLHCKKAYQECSLVTVGAIAPVLPTSETVEALKRIKLLEGVLVVNLLRMKLS